MTWTDAQNWLDLLDHIWIGLVLIAVAAVPAIMSAKNHSGIKKIQDQVVNGHKEPLRNDLDKVIRALSEQSDKVDSISHGLTSLREELIQEEVRRRSGITELREDFDRKMEQIAKRFTA